MFTEPDRLFVFAYKLKAHNNYAHINYPKDTLNDNLDDNLNSLIVYSLLIKVYLNKISNTTNVSINGTITRRYNLAISGLLLSRR